MRRPLALLATALSLAALPARAGEPLDLVMGQLGSPSTATGASAAQATASRVDFARLSTGLALGLTSTLLEPASTTGASGWDLALEATNTPVSIASSAWRNPANRPASLVTPSFHLRKAFPYSLEVGGRLVYLSRSQYYATQLSLKWAFLEGFSRLPDVAVRLAYTRMDGVAHLALSTTEVDLIASHRFGVNAIFSLTPYLALRYSRLTARTPAIQWASPVGAASAAAFPTLDTGLFRTTVGGRLTSYALSLAAEVTYFGGVTGGSSSSTDESAYPRHKVPSSLAAALRLGFEF